MALYLREYGLDVAIRARVASGLALFGLCAGAIILCEEVDGAPGPLGLLPARATRNFYGRQLASFEDDIETDLGPFHGIFIRAPRLEALGETRVIGRRRAGGSNGSVGEAVLLRRGRILAGSFHPELSGDDRIHEFFLGMVAGRG
jgi:5'-phosphate synthase pdxT subunit